MYGQLDQHERAEQPQGVARRRSSHRPRRRKQPPWFFRVHGRDDVRSLSTRTRPDLKPPRLRPCPRRTLPRPRRTSSGRDRRLRRGRATVATGDADLPSLWDGHLAGRAHGPALRGRGVFGANRFDLGSALRRSEKLPEIVAVNPGVAQDPCERAALEFTVKRDHERVRPFVMFESHVATALANGNPSDPLERVDQLLAGENRQPLAHAGSGSVRRTIPISSERPSSRSPST